MHTCIIAEAGVNHNGNLELAKKLCLEAKKSGADVVKFQTWKTEKIITQNVKKADYQEQNTGNSQSQYEMLKELELPYSAFRIIKNYCDEIGIQFASTADDDESLDFLVDLGIPFIKVGSGDMRNISYLRKMGSKNLPVILSTGMSDLKDIELSLHALREGGAKEISLLHCTTSYPCLYENANLNAINTMYKKFGLPVGYSDHTLGIEVPIAAVAMGASIIEKHFTLDRMMKGPDHIASMDPNEFSKMVEAIRHIEVAMGDGEKKPTVEEQGIAKVVLKKIVAKRYIPCGKIIEEDDICVKRNENGMPADAWDSIIGKRTEREYQMDEGIDIK